MSKVIRQMRKRQRLTAGDVKILEKFKFVEKYIDGSSTAIEEIEKTINEIKKAMVIYNKIIDILNQKGMVTHEEIQKELQKDGRIQITEGKDPDTRQSDIENNSGS